MNTRLAQAAPAPSASAWSVEALEADRSEADLYYRIASRAWLTGVMGDPGEFAEGRALLEDALKDDIRTGGLNFHSGNLVRLSEICFLTGCHDEAWQHARQALDLARPLKER